MKRFIVFVMVILCLIVGIIGFVKYQEYQEYQRYQEYQNSIVNLPPAEPSIESNLPDSDGDGFSDWFEENVAGYDPNVSNDRYFLYCEYLPETEKEHNIEFNLTWHVLVEENGVPAQNIIRLAGEKSTRSNLQKAIEEIAVKADENDIVFVRFLGHGGHNGIVCCCDGGIGYSNIDELLDGIRAKVVIVKIGACKCECAAKILKEGSCPRIVLTGGFSMEGFSNKETADKYPWMPTYADYGWNNPDPALDYNDIFFGFADKITGNGDGYVSIGEFIKLLKEDVENRRKTEVWKNTTGYPWWDVARDEYGISDKIYLIEHSPKKNIFWEAFNS